MTYLRQFGHNMKQVLTAKSVVQGIRLLDGAIFAESDHRKGGIPDGYWHSPARASNDQQTTSETEAGSL